MRDINFFNSSLVSVEGFKKFGRYYICVRSNAGSRKGQVVFKKRSRVERMKKSRSPNMAPNYTMRQKETKDTKKEINQYIRNQNPLQLFQRRQSTSLTVGKRLDDNEDVIERSCLRMSDILQLWKGRTLVSRMLGEGLVRNVSVAESRVAF